MCATYHIEPPGRVLRADGNACLYGKRYKYDCYNSCFRAVPRIRGRRGHHFHRTSTPACTVLSSSSAAVTKTAAADDTNTKAEHDEHRCSHCCYCCLDVRAVFAQPHDIPRPVLPIYPCEMHELLCSLPPLCQNYSWTLRFDTARDGFSLATLYRLLAPAAAAHEPTVGMLFLSTHTRAAPPRAMGHDETNRSAEGRAGRGELLHAKDEPMPHWHNHASHLRHGRGTPLLCNRPHVSHIIGCYTPDAPSQQEHSQRCFSGSAETFVFRVNVAQTPRCVCMAGDDSPKEDPMRGGRVIGEGAHAAHWASAHAVHFGYVGESSSSSSVSSENEAEHDINLCLAGKDDNMVCAYRHDMRPARDVCEAMKRCAERSELRQHDTPTVPTAVRRPVVEQFGWCGDARQHEFMYCGDAKLCFGGRAESEAAITLDGSLQHGTCGTWCGTFSCPSLVESSRSDGSSCSDSAFVVHRLVWFSIRNSDDAFRDMASPEKARWCGCGRCSVWAPRDVDGGRGQCVAQRHTCLSEVWNEMM